MSNWTAITETLLATGKNSSIMTSVQSLAAAQSLSDPVPEMIADVTATIRAAISTGNILDLDATKIPNSLKGLAIRMLTLRLKDYVEMEMSPYEKVQAEADRSYLNRIMDEKIRFELPDEPGGSAEMQTPGSLETISGTCRDQYTRRGMDGL